MKKHLWISGVLLVVIAIAGGTALTHQTQTASAATISVTHNSITQSQINSFAPLGLEINTSANVTPDSRILSESEALKSTDTLLTQFHGVSRNIQYLLMSRRLGSGFEPVNPALTQGDPHFQNTNNEFRNIPCYLVTINGVNIPAASSGTPGGKQLNPAPAHQLQAIIDATNGQILMIFAIHPDQNPVH